MRTLLAFVVLTVSSFAQASYFRIECSDGAQTVKMTSGHIPSVLSVTERTWTDDGAQDKVITLEEANVAILKETEIEHTSEKHCQKGESYGYATWRHIDYQKVEITQKDGALFSGDVIGVSKDHKSVTADLICEQVGNSHAPCN